MRIVSTKSGADRCTPQAMASLQNLAIGALRLTGRDDLADGLHHHGRGMTPLASPGLT
ncbi:hypothetical protein [Streptomyces sp. NPDC004546]|uniref:hypothetical protein n=1 Tax=unclassified Streptomyces TaxID=2593676 RepID=UPI00339DD7B9